MKEDILSLMNEYPLDIAKLHELLSQMNTVDVADMFEDLSKEEAVRIFRLLPKDIAADVFSYIVSETKQIIVESLTDDEVGSIMSELFVDDAVDFIEEMPANVVKRVLLNTKDEKREIINQILQYPDDSVGSIMTIEYIDLKEDATVREAFDRIRKSNVHGSYTCYVVRRDRLLIGAISVKTLMLAKQHERIGDLTDKKIIYAHTLDDQEEAAGLFRKYGLLSIPVVDQEKRLVGIVTVDDMVHIIEEEATEDFQKMAAIVPSDEPYLKTGVFKLAGNRIGWLLFLMLSATITGTIISNYEVSLAVMPVLVTFIPMLMDTSGNAGCQTSTLIIRSMAVDEINFKDIFKVLWKEIQIGVLCGLGLGIVNFIRVLLMNSGDAVLALVVSLALLIIVILANSIACLLPMLAKKMKLDPAVLASPLITTILDGTSLLIFFSIARIILKI